MARFIGSRKDLTEDKMEELEELVLDSTKAQAIFEAARVSMGKLLMCVCVHVCVCVCLCACMCWCVHVCVCLSVLVCACLCVHECVGVCVRGSDSWLVLITPFPPLTNRNGHLSN